MRGAAPEPEHTLVCGGFGHGFGVLCRALRARGIEQIAIEAPGSPLHRLTAAAAGLEPIPVGVDETGIDTDQLAASGCEVAVLTPSHQYPTGTVLSPERRASLLAWAEEEDALIVEDDYDSELRYDRVAVGALQGLSPERICQIGSVSLRLAPGLRVGWMLSPSWLTGALTYELGVSAGAPSVLDQLALREFIACGDLDRHLRRMRAVYRARRAAMIAALWARLPGAVVRGISAGCFLPLSLGSDVDADAVVRRAAASGVAVRRVAPTPSSLVLGYANLPEATIQRGVAVLADAVTAARGTAALASTSGRSSRWTPT